MTKPTEEETNIERLKSAMVCTPEVLSLECKIIHNLVERVECLEAKVSDELHS